MNEDAFHALERRMIVLQRDHERVQNERDDLQRRVTDAAAAATQANAKIASLQQVCRCSMYIYIQTGAAIDRSIHPHVGVS